jgi:hypothetical protein
MKHLLTLIIIGLVLSGCLPTLSSDKTASNAGTESASTDSVSPESNKKSPTGTDNQGMGLARNSVVPESMPMAITANPPMVPVLTAEPIKGWQTFTSTAWGIAVDYPADWSVVEQADAITFNSPQGKKIGMQILTLEGGNWVSKDQQCATLLNNHGVSIDTCFEEGTSTYSAKFGLPSGSGSPGQLLLFTNGRDALYTYLKMLDSLRPLP